MNNRDPDDARKPFDPLTSPLLATLTFGAIFLVAFAVNVIKALVGLRPLPSGTGADEPGAHVMLLAWLCFALLSGGAVAFLRRRITGMPRRNLATGLVVGALYAAACFLTFGSKLRWGAGPVVLVGGVWAGVAWAVTSGLNEVLGDGAGSGRESERGVGDGP